MIVILASASNKLAKNLVMHWKTSDVRILNCHDLSTPGWRYYPDDIKKSIAVINGKEIPVEEIEGILTLLPSIMEPELYNILPSEREYVAAEMMAFLVSWLSSLTCPVLNRPTPSSLIGPNWRSEQWIYAAAKVGIPVTPANEYHSHSWQKGNNTNQEKSFINNIQTTTVIVVGNQCFGSIKHDLAEKSIQLSRLARTDLLSVKFSNSDNGELLFAGVEIIPRTMSSEIEMTILNYIKDKHIS